ncbi:hypothetical protein QJR26_18335 (plasmid) [Clostridium baratii]
MYIRDMAEMTIINNIGKTLGIIYMLGTFIGAILLIISFCKSFKSLTVFQTTAITLIVLSTIGVIFIIFIIAIIFTIIT